MFTIPVPAQPERAPRWRWTLPVLQGATALVALLLFFVVAGDFFVTGLLRAPEAPAAVMLEQSADVQVTFEAEAEPVIEAPVEEAAPPQPAPETEALEALPAEGVESDSAAEPAAEPATALPTPEPVATSLPEWAASPQPENGTMGAGFDTTPDEVTKETEVEAEGEAKAVEEARVMAPEVASTEPVAATEVVEPSPVPLPTVAPTQTLLPTPTSLPPTIMAAAPEPAPSTLDEQTVTGTLSEPWIRWVGIAEIVLAIAFVLLATATVLLMIQRRRTG
jgi:hypothetical protein